MVVSIAITNSIVDMIPSILFGAPDSGSELSVLPGHRMLMKGLGYDAIKLTVIGSLIAGIISVLLLPGLIFVINNLYTQIHSHIYLILIFIMLFIILSEKKKIHAVGVFILSGLIGIISSGLPLNNNLILFPILSGMFGASMLLIQILHGISVPKQKESKVESGKFIPAFVGTIGGIIAGFLPGIGSSQISAFASTKDDESFLTMVGAITTSYILFSMVSLWVIGKARSGSAVIISTLTSVGLNEFLILIVIGVMTCAIASVITLKIAKFFIRFVEKINYTSISKVILFILISLVIYFTGLIGLYLFIISTCLGVFTNLSEVRRGNMMGVLILPVILYFL